MVKEIRPSGLIKRETEEKKPALFTEESLEEFNSALSDFEDEYSKLLIKSGKGRVNKAYFVSFYDEPSLVYISFNTSREKAKWEAVQYFASFSFNVSYKEKSTKFLKAKRKRIPEFDKYLVKGKVPIKELLKRGMSFHCAVCGKVPLSWEDIKEKNGFIIQDDFEMNPFTEGIVVCPHCYQRFKK